MTGQDTCARKSSKGTVVFTATTYTKRYGGQLYMREELECDREPKNSCDRYTVAVKKSGVVICHESYRESVRCF